MSGILPVFLTLVFTMMSTIVASSMSTRRMTVDFIRVTTAEIVAPPLCYRGNKTHQTTNFTIGLIYLLHYLHPKFCSLIWQRTKKIKNSLQHFILQTGKASAWGVGIVKINDTNRLRRFEMRKAAASFWEERSSWVCPAGKGRKCYYVVRSEGNNAQIRIPVPGN